MFYLFEKSRRYVLLGGRERNQYEIQARLEGQAVANNHPLSSDIPNRKSRDSQSSRSSE